MKIIYVLTTSFPSEERYGLMSQMRRAAVSIPSNIAEGQARRTTPDFVRFISMAQGSLAELDTQLTISVELGYCSREETAGCVQLMDENRKMLSALRRTLLAKSQVNP